MFQFHKVRLKGPRAELQLRRNHVSIPQGTIKRCTDLIIFSEYEVSIPQGTIKRRQMTFTIAGVRAFQFHKVRLKGPTALFFPTSMQRFNSTRYD